MEHEHIYALPIGHVLNSLYTIEKVIGSGGFGITYLAHYFTIDPASNQSHKVEGVIKENYPSSFAFRDGATLSLNPSHSRERFEWAMANFENEVKMLSLVNHPAVVKVLDSFRENNTAYYVMPHIQGVALNQIEDGSWLHDERKLVSLLLILLDALQVLHSQNILHRDIKPHNILLKPNLEPVLIDFGAARFQIVDETHSHTAMASIGYTPIEQMQSMGKRGPWTDIYSLGATLYTLMTRIAPTDSVGRSTDDPHQWLRNMPCSSHYSEALIASIDKAMQYHQSHRWQTAAEWMEALHEQLSLDVAFTRKPQHYDYIRVKIYLPAGCYQSNKRVHYTIDDKKVRVAIPDDLELGYVYKDADCYEGRDAHVSFHIHETVYADVKFCKRASPSCTTTSSPSAYHTALEQTTDIQERPTVVESSIKEQSAELDAAESATPCPFCSKQIETKASEVCYACPHCRKRLGIDGSASLFDHLLFTLPRIFQTRGRASAKEAWSLYFYATLGLLLVEVILVFSILGNHIDILFNPWWGLLVALPLSFLINILVVSILAPLLCWGLFVRCAHNRNKSAGKHYLHYGLALLGSLLFAPLLAVCGTLVLDSSTNESRKNNIYGPKTRV